MTITQLGSDNVDNDDNKEDFTSPVIVMTRKYEEECLLLHNSFFLHQKFLDQQLHQQQQDF